MLIKKVNKDRKEYLKNKKRVRLCEGDVHKYHLAGNPWVKDVNNEDGVTIAREQYVLFVCQDCGHSVYMPLQFNEKSNPDE